MLTALPAHLIVSDFELLLLLLSLLGMSFFFSPTSTATFSPGSDALARCRL